MIKTDLLVIGGGPAGLCAAVEAGNAGANVLLLERSHALGGQLIKQTHMFFGSEKQYASTRGFNIADILLDKLHAMPNVRIIVSATVLSVYEDGVVTAEIGDRYEKILPRAIVVATGASEKNLAFPNNDLPGVYGAGAVQTLMNQYGTLPGNNVVMIGAGNIGLIVSYQLMQAGVNVKAVVEGAGQIGGYLVHAAKLRRMGVPILTSHTVKSANGTDSLESVTIWALDDKWQGVPGTEQTLEADTLCVAVGLSPLSELLWQAGCEMKFIGALSGHVPMRDENLCTSVKNIFVAGDVAGIEEASSAMVEGYLAGLSAAVSLGYPVSDYQEKSLDYHAQLDSLRRGHVGERIRSGLAQAALIGTGGTANA